MSGRPPGKRDTSVRIERLAEADAREIVEIVGVEHGEFRCYEEDSWSSEELMSWIGQLEDVCCGARDYTGTLVGYCLTHFNRGAAKVYVENIYVSPVARRHGIGSSMLQFVRESYRGCGVRRFVGLVKSGNDNARRFFRSNGFFEGEEMLWVQAEE